MFIFLVVSSKTVTCKVFEKCEFAEELYLNQLVPANEIYQHLCVAGLNTNIYKGNLDYLGIYAIGDQWWCKWNGEGGGCNINCSKLYDEDISDDVVCMKTILEQQGVGSWGHTKKSCLKQHLKTVTECLKIPLNLLTSYTADEDSKK